MSARVDGEERLMEDAVSEASSIKDSPNSSDSPRELRATAREGRGSGGRAGGLERRREGGVDRQRPRRPGGERRQRCLEAQCRVAGWYALLTLMHGHVMISCTSRHILGICVPIRAAKYCLFSKQCRATMM